MPIPTSHAVHGVRQDAGAASLKGCVASSINQARAGTLYLNTEHRRPSLSPNKQTNPKPKPVTR